MIMVTRVLFVLIYYGNFIGGELGIYANMDEQTTSYNNPKNLNHIVFRGDIWHNGCDLIFRQATITQLSNSES